MQKFTLITNILLFFIVINANAQFSGGSGTENDPYLVLNLSDLQLLSENDIYRSSHFVQTADIDAINTNTWNVGNHDEDVLTPEEPMGFKPIANTYGLPFTGTYNGKGYTIYNLYINRPVEDFVGLFGGIIYGSIDSLNLMSVNISGYEYIGCITGSTRDSYISHCNCSGTVSGLSKTGGLIGYSESEISKCSSTCDVSGNVRTGGLVGSGSGSISESYSVCSVIGIGDYVGGLVGNNSGKISKSYSVCSVISNDDYVGGLVGYNSGSIFESYSEGYVSGSYCVGGLIGVSTWPSYFPKDTIDQSYSTCSVLGESSVGGLIGHTDNYIITQSYSLDSVVGDQDVGGLIGNMYNTFLYNSYSSSSLEGDLRVGGLIGNSPSQALGTNIIIQCYSTGTVSGGSELGGLIGAIRKTNVSHSYSVGYVIGTGSYVGGFTGRSNSTSIVENSFWDMETSSQDVSPEGLGKSSMEMQDLCVFLNTGWDFYGETDNGIEDYWVMNNNENGGYPALTWQSIVHAEECCGLTIPIPTSGIDSTICYGNSYVYSDGTEHLNIMTGEFHTSILEGQATNGCDSIITENIHVLPIVTGAINNYVCSGESYTFLDGTVHHNITENENYTSVLAGEASNSCDSLVIENIFVLGVNNIDTLVCFGGSYIYADGTERTNLTINESHISTIITVNSCDSVITENLTVLPELTGTCSETVCYGDSIIVNGTTYNASNIAGIEVFTGIGSNSCDSTVIVELTILPEIDVTVNIVGITITAAVTGLDYQWIDCDDNNNPILGEINQVYTATVNGNYAVEVMDGTCVNTSDCISITTVGIQSNDIRNQLFIYPNPTTDVTTISGFGIKQIIILDITGKVVEKINKENNEQTFDLSNQAKGIYFVKVLTSQGIIIKKLVFE